MRAVLQCCSTLLAVAVSLPENVGTCCSSDGACNAEAPSRPKSVGKWESVLMQMEIKAALELRSSPSPPSVGGPIAFDEVEAQDTLAKSFGVDPSNTAGAIQCGLQAIITSTAHFMAETPRISDGIVELGLELFQCVVQLLTQEQTNQKFIDFKQSWTATFEGIPGTVKKIEADIKLYISTGEPPPLIRAIGSIIHTASSIVTEFLPAETGTEVQKYLDAVSETFQVMGQSWDDFTEGQTAEGIESIYLGLRGIFDGLAPEAWKNNTIYTAVISSLDTILGKLSKHVLEYERHILESKVCWRAQKNRNRLIADVCPDGYVSGGDSYCYPMVLLQQQGFSANDRNLDAATQGKDGGNRRRHNGSPSPWAIPARCDSDSSFSQKHGHFCYTTCGAGFQEKSQFKCISSCEGNFSTETPAMCGRDPGIVTKAILEMVTTVLNSGFVLADNIIQMKKHGVNGETLSSTIQVFIDMGKPFANPICPVPDGADSPLVLPDSRRRGARRFAKPKPTCSLGERVFITSHRGGQLYNGNGKVKFTSNKQSWEEWTLSDAGDGKVFITSHHGKQLCDKYGKVKATPNKKRWEKWQLADAGDGKVFITSLRHQHLQDKYGAAKLSWNPGRWEAFTISDMSGENVCSVPPPSTTSPMPLPTLSPTQSQRKPSTLSPTISPTQTTLSPMPSPTPSRKMVPTPPPQPLPTDSTTSSPIVSPTASTPLPTDFMSEGDGEAIKNEGDGEALENEGDGDALENEGDGEATDGEGDRGTANVPIL
jgi:hypothetical protein